MSWIRILNFPTCVLSTINKYGRKCVKFLKAKNNCNKILPLRNIRQVAYMVTWLKGIRATTAMACPCTVLVAIGCERLARRVDVCVRHRIRVVNVAHFWQGHLFHFKELSSIFQTSNLGTFLNYFFYSFIDFHSKI